MGVKKINRWKVKKSNLKKSVTLVMSTHFHIDSRWRDRKNYPNPAEFFIPVEVTNGWRTENRTVQAVRPHDKQQVTNMVHTVKLLNLTVPYDFGGTTGTAFVDFYPFVYVSLQSTTMYKDNKLINTLENGNVVNKTVDIDGNLKTVSLKDATFVAYCDKIQGGLNGPAWIQFKSSMIQTYRINLKDGLTFRVFTPDGQTLSIVDIEAPENADPSKQVNALFEVTPYARDADYDNHFVTLYNRDA